MIGDDVLVRVETHLVEVLGPSSGRAAVSFVGAEPIEVLRFGPDSEGVVRYASVGMARAPMTDAAAVVVAPQGPRAELVLSVRGVHDGILRALATLAASPAIEGLVLEAGAGLDLGQPLWENSRFTAVLVGESGALIGDLSPEDVRFLPLFPMTANEAAWKRVHGAHALEERWLTQGCDLRDPDRPQADLA